MGLVDGYPKWKAKVSANLSDSLSPNAPCATVRVFDNRELLSWSSNVNKKAHKAFEILARENSRMLTVYLRSLVRDEAAVDDLFQEAMVVAWRRLDECDLDRPFGPWLSTASGRRGDGFSRSSD